jgi:tetratricopeptide (TPR) repeat protein
MLFDLQSGKRRTMIRIVYAALAALFLIGFVGFSIGSSNVGGGLFDALGLTDSSSGGSPDTATVYDSQIQDAQRQLKQNPNDPTALSDLAYYHYLAGQVQGGTDETTQQFTVTDETRDQWNQALDAWEKYLKTDPKQVELTKAGPIVQAYVQLGDASGAVKTQKLIAAQAPSLQSYGTLAYLYYANGDLGAGDKAADKATAKAKGKQAKQVSKQLDQLRKQAQALKAQAGAQSQGQGPPQIQDPFGGLGPSSGTVSPTVP